MLTQEEIMVLEHAIDNVWSLADYLAYMNQQARDKMAANPGLWCSELTEDLAYWAEDGIHTARDLADYLDACFEREVQKSQYDYLDEAGPVSEEQIEAVMEWADRSAPTLADIWPNAH